MKTLLFSLAPVWAVLSLINAIPTSPVYPPITAPPRRPSSSNSVYHDPVDLRDDIASVLERAYAFPSSGEASTSSHREDIIPDLYLSSAPARTCNSVDQNSADDALSVDMEQLLEEDAATSSDEPARLSVPHVFHCIQVDDRSCLRRLTEQFCTFTPSQILAIAIAYEKKNGESPMVHWLAECSDFPARVKNAIAYNFYTWKLMRKITESVGALKKTLKVSILTDQHKSELVHVIEQSIQFNELSRKFYKEVVTRSAEFQNQKNATLDSYYQGLSKTFANNDQLKLYLTALTNRTASVPLIKRIFTKIYTGWKLDQHFQCQKVSRYVSKVEHSMARAGLRIQKNSSSMYESIAPPLEVIAFGQACADSLENLWTTVIIQGRQDLLDQLIRFGLFNLARANEDGTFYVQAAVYAFDYFPALRSAKRVQILDLILSHAGMHVLKEMDQVLRTVALQLNDVNLIRTVLAHYPELETKADVLADAVSSHAPPPVIEALRL